MGLPCCHQMYKSLGFGLYINGRRQAAKGGVIFQVGFISLLQIRYDEYDETMEWRC